MLLHEFFGEGDYKNRRASVSTDDDGFRITYFLDDEPYNYGTVYTETFAEVLAEDWVLGDTHV